MARSKKAQTKKAVEALGGYEALIADLVAVIEDARRAAARSVNRGHDGDLLARR